jgi:HEAT repeat protein
VFTAVVVLTSQMAVADESRVDRLVRQLRGGNVTERWQAARLLGTLGLEAKPAALYLTIALHDENHTVRYYAARSLGKIGPVVGDIAGANLLLAADHDSREHVREQALQTLLKIDPTPMFFKVPWLYARFDGQPQDLMKEFRTDKYKPIFDLVLQLQHQEATERTAAARLLGRLKWRAAPAATALTAALRDEDETVRLSAAEALGAIGSAAFYVANASLLRVAKSDPAKKVRDQATVTLRKITPRPIDWAVADRRPSGMNSVATRAMLSAGLMPPFNQLTRQLRSSSVSSRRYAAWEFGRLQPDDRASFQYIRYALTDDDEEVRFNAVTALGRVGRTAGQGAGIRLTVLRSRKESQRVIRRAILAMHLISPITVDEFVSVEGEAVDPKRKVTNLDLWLQKLKGPDVQQQIGAILELRKSGIDGRVTVPHLVPLLRHKNRFTRTFAAETIGMLGFEKHAAAALSLAELLDDDPVEMVRDAAREALLLNLDANAVAQLREPEPPARPTPERVKRKERSLTPNNIKMLVDLLRDEPEHRGMALRMLEARMDDEGLASILVPLAMGSKRELRSVGMSALWDIATQADVAAPLAYALHGRLGNAHTIELIDRIDADDVFAPFLIPYLVQSEDSAIRQAGLEALIRVGRKRDWRKFLAAPWAHLDDELHNNAKRALNSLSVQDSFALSFIAGELTNGDDGALAKMVIGLAATKTEKTGRVRPLYQLYRAEQSAVSRMAIVWSLSQQKPMQMDVSAELFDSILENEPERPIRDAVVLVLGGYGPAAESALPGLLRRLEQETSTESRMTIAGAVKIIGVGNRELQAIVVSLEESLRIQRAREILATIIEEQQHLEEATQRNRKRSLLRLLGN